MTLPELHLADWRPTKDTLHLYCQILGKVRLATTSPRNHWWNVPLYVNVRGLTTRRLHHEGTAFEIVLDFLDDALVVQSGDGRTDSFSLVGGLPVADFDACLHDALQNLGVDVAILEKPFGVPMKTPFREDTEHASWDHDAVHASGASSTGRTPSSRSSAAGSTARRALCTSSGTASTSPLRASRDGRAETRAQTRHAGGLLARGHLVRLLARDDNVPRRRLLLLHRARARGSARAAARRRRVDAHRQRRRRSPSSRTRRFDRPRIPGAPCSRSARAPTRPGPASPGGTRSPSPLAPAPLRGAAGAPGDRCRTVRPPGRQLARAD